MALCADPGPRRDGGDGRRAVTETAAGPSIFELLAQVKRQLGPVGKDSTNKQQGFRFRGIDAVLNAVAPVLDEHGVITVPHLEKVTFGTVAVGQNRTPMAHAQVEVTYTFYGPRGDSFPATVPGEAMDSGDKATAKAMSVAFRTALIQTLNLPTGDPDPDEETYQRSPGRNAGDAFDDAAPSGSQNQRRRPSNDTPPDSRGEEEWVRDFYATLGDTTDEDALVDLRKQVNQAIKDKIISPRVGTELNRAINDHRSKMSEAHA